MTNARTIVSNSPGVRPVCILLRAAPGTGIISAEDISVCGITRDLELTGRPSPNRFTLNHKPFESVTADCKYNKPEASKM
jgi:hypothetical protein